MLPVPSSFRQDQSTVFQRRKLALNGAPSDTGKFDELCNEETSSRLAEQQSEQFLLRSSKENIG